LGLFWSFEVRQYGHSKLWTLRDNLVHQSPEDSNGSIALLVLMAAEVEYQLCISQVLRDPFGEEDGEHCFSLARAPGYPKKARVAMEPRQVTLILRNPFTSAIDPRPFRTYKVLSIDVGIGEEESVSTRAGVSIEGFYHHVLISN
jgi:hypothetical protein